jgi:hypothetical protein
VYPDRTPLIYYIIIINTVILCHKTIGPLIILLDSFNHTGKIMLSGSLCETRPNPLRNSILFIARFTKSLITNLCSWNEIIFVTVHAPSRRIHTHESTRSGHELQSIQGKNNKTYKRERRNRLLSGDVNYFRHNDDDNGQRQRISLGVKKLLGHIRKRSGAHA